MRHWKAKHAVKYLTVKQNEFGNYIFCFTTKLKHATEKDIELIPNYGIDLISSYTKVDPRLIRLREDKNEMGNHSITNRYLTYSVMSVPAITLGKLRVLIQRTKNYNQINFVYYKRVSSHQYIQRKRLSGTSKIKSRQAKTSQE